MGRRSLLPAIVSIFLLAPTAKALLTGASNGAESRIKVTLYRRAISSGAKVSSRPGLDHPQQDPQQDGLLRDLRLDALAHPWDAEAGNMAMVPSEDGAHRMLKRSGMVSLESSQGRDDKSELSEVLPAVDWSSVDNILDNMAVNTHSAVQPPIQENGDIRLVDRGTIGSEFRFVLASSKRRQRVLRRSRARAMRKESRGKMRQRSAAPIIDAVGITMPLLILFGFTLSQPLQ